MTSVPVGSAGGAPASGAASVVVAAGSTAARSVAVVVAALAGTVSRMVVLARPSSSIPTEKTTEFPLRYSKERERERPGTRMEEASAADTGHTVATLDQRRSRLRCICRRGQLPRSESADSQTRLAEVRFRLRLRHSACAGRRCGDRHGQDEADAHARREGHPARGQTPLCAGACAKAAVIAVAGHADSTDGDALLERDA